MQRIQFNSTRMFFNCERTQPLLPQVPDPALLIPCHYSKSRGIRLLVLLVILMWTNNPVWAKVTSVLFIGNSYTIGQHPDFHSFANAAGDTVYTERSTFGGYTFFQHTTNSQTFAKINSRAWDFVVLQEQSQMPSFPPSQVASDVYPYATQLDSMIKANNPCTETIFFMTWGRKDGDQQNCQFYQPLCTYDGMQQRLKESYLEMGDMNKATVAPVGVAWKNVRDMDSTINLYAPDGSHPDVNGTYLGACIFYATIFQKSPQGVPWYGSVDTTTAHFLQDIATTVVLDSMDKWRINANVAKAQFSTTDTLLEVQFTDNSQNALSWHWDLGDGDTSTLQHPTHEYAADGTYTVCLSIDNGCTTDTFCQDITVACPPATAAFMLDQSGDTVNLTYQGTHAGSFEWDLGDGNLATDSNVQHIYTQPGDYLISLSVYAECGDAVDTQTITIAAPPDTTTNFVALEHNWSNAHAFPNPCTGCTAIQIPMPADLNQNATLEMWDCQGRLIALNTPQSPAFEKQNGTLVTIGMPKGLYLFRIVDPTTNATLAQGKILLQ